MRFGPDNLGDAAINSFLQKHSCSVYCRRLGLEGEYCAKGSDRVKLFGKCTVCVCDNRLALS